MPSLNLPVRLGIAALALGRKFARKTSLMIWINRRVIWSASACPPLSKIAPDKSTRVVK